LDVLVARKVLVAPDVTPGKETLHGIVSMLVGLIRSNSSDRLHEDQVEYQVGNHETNDTTDVNHRSAENPTRSYFDHEKLKVYQAALEFITLGNGFLERYQHSRTISERLDRASTSIPLNIAEGNGKFTAADRCRFFDQAHGAALSCAACLDLVAAKDKSESVQISDGKALLQQIVAMLVGLIKSNSSDRLHEQAAGYRNGGDLSTYDGRTD
jgi:four helix bundle protein